MSESADPDCSKRRRTEKTGQRRDVELAEVQVKNFYDQVKAARNIRYWTYVIDILNLSLQHLTLSRFVFALTRYLIQCFQTEVDEQNIYGRLEADYSDVSLNLPV